MSIRNPSPEQQAIVDGILRGENIIVDAVAGSGKTSTCECIAKACPTKNIIILVYSRRLAQESAPRFKQFTNVKTYTIHGSTCNFLKSPAHTDAGLIKITQTRKHPIKNINFDILIIDESQDMIKEYYEYIIHFINMNNKQIQLIILGDQYQNIYQYKGGDARFLLLASRLYNQQFVIYPLRVSYRVTPNIARFVNQVMLNEHRIDVPTNKPIGAPIHIWNGDGWVGNLTKMYKYIESLNPNDVFILAPSTKSSDNKDMNKTLCNNDNHTNLIANSLCKYNIPVYKLNNDKYNEKAARGKVVLMTMHAAKGLERPYVFIIGFDKSFFMSPNTMNMNYCPNIHYVAATRSLKELHLISHCHNAILPYLNIHSLNNMIKDGSIVVNGNILNFSLSKPNRVINNKLKTISVTEFVNNIKPNFALRLQDIIDNIFDSTIISLPTSVCVDIESCCKQISINGIEYHEPVADLTADAINAIFSPKTFEIYKQLSKQIPLKDKVLIDEVDDVYVQAIKFANMARAITDNLLYRLKQIYQYNWLKSDCASNIINNNMLPILGSSENLTSEHEIQLTQEHNNIELTITGRIDFISQIDKCIWETKLTNFSEFQLEHKLQLAMYYIMSHKLNDEITRNCTWNLLNTMNGQFIKIKQNIPIELFEEMFTLLLDNNLFDTAVELSHISNDGFIAKVMERKY